MQLNNKCLSEYDGILLDGYTVGGCEVDLNLLDVSMRTSLHILRKHVGMKKLIVPIAFKGSNIEDASYKKSIFERDAFGKNELVMDDGLLYWAALSNIGKSTYSGTKIIRTEYEFIGIRHGDYKKVIGNTIYCESTLPYTDCILSVTVSEDALSYKVGSVTFKNVVAGEVLTVDGMNGRILVNGIPAAERADWIEFPKLTPGINNLQCIDTLTVEFYPVYF